MSIPLLDTAIAVTYPLVAGLAEALAPIGGAAAVIVVCTVALRLLLLPLTLAAVRGERARALLTPRVAELRKRHGRDTARLGTELTELYRGAGVSPLAGVLPLLAQAPMAMVWYRTLTARAVAGLPNALLNQRFLGAPLSAHLVTGGHPLAFVPLLLALVVLAVAAIARSRRVAAAAGGPAPGVLASVLPFATLVSAAVLPLVAVLYLVTTIAWTTGENVALRRGLPAAAP